MICLLTNFCISQFSNAKIEDKVLPPASNAAKEKRELEKLRPKNIKFPDSF